MQWLLKLINKMAGVEYDKKYEKTKCVNHVEIEI